MSTDRTGTPEVKSKSQGELRAEARLARAELAGTLDAIEYKLNIPRQCREAGQRISARLHKLGDESPLALAGVALGAATAAGAAVWLGVKAVLRR
jgi:hypothetical protein